jgi:cell division protein FtsQ
MPKAAPPKRFNWRLTFAILFGFVLFVSTAMATRRVQSMLLTNDRFALESDFLAPAAGGVPVIPGIRIEGNRYVSRERILHVFAPDVNKSIFRIPIAERRRRLLGIDWVEEASVLRIWPNHLIVKVRERRPVAFAKLPVGNGQQFHYMLIDAQGVLLSVPKQKFDFPVLTGVTEDQSDIERRQRVVAMQTLLTQLGPAAHGMVTEINAATPQDLRVSARVGGHNVELWLGDRRYLARFQDFNNHFDEIMRQSDGASVFDLRIDNNILTVQQPGSRKEVEK